MKEVRFKANIEHFVKYSGYLGEHRRSPFSILQLITKTFGFTREQQDRLEARGEAIIVCSPEAFIGFVIDGTKRGQYFLIHLMGIEMVDIESEKDKPLILRAAN